MAKQRKQSRTKRSVCAVAACALALSALVTGCKSEEQIQEQQFITSTQESANYYDTRSVLNVTGEGRVMLQPDTAVVGFTVHTHDVDAATAQQLNTETMDAVMKVIRSKGVPDEDIETGRLNINEVYDYEKSPAEIVGYDVYYSVTVTMHDLDRLGALVSEAVAAGASDVSGPEYSITDDTPAYMEALGMAVEAAQAKAEIMAQKANVRLAGLPLTLNEESGAGHAVYSNTTDMALEASVMEEPAEEAPAPIEISIPEIEVLARVTASYQILR